MCVQIPDICYTYITRRTFMSIAIKEKRIEFRISEDDKQTIEDAARLSRISLSSYIVSVVLKQAKFDLEMNEIITLNNKERNALMAAFKNPPQPNKALRNLFK